jgi:hypothetical protein
MDHHDLYSPDWASPRFPFANCPFHNPLQKGWQYRHFGVYDRKTHPQTSPQVPVPALPRHLQLPDLQPAGRWRQYRWLEVETRSQKINRRHRLKYAA